MKSKLQRLKEKLDKLIQQYYVPLNPRCLVCNAPTSEMHHYVQKHQSMNLRWDEKNLIPLCRNCHCRHHLSGDPSIHETIIRIKGFKWVDEVEKDRYVLYTPKEKELRELIDTYKQKIEEIVK